MSVKDNSSPVISDGLTKQALFDAGASYLITGGFGGFGLETAEWMAKHGARHLILASRSGASSDASRAALKALENNKVRIIAVAADVSEEAQVTALLARVAAEFPPLRGILHCAAVLDDAPISELNPGRMENAMRAKALGAWHLHRCSQGHPLDFFVLFSSVSAIIGNGRQANYSAANAYLDTLAEARRAMGLPATSINWGAISTGMAVESEEVKAHLEVMGMRPLTATQALDAWACLLDAKAPQYGLMDIDWPRWREFEPTGGNSPRFSDLMGMPGAKLDGSQLLTETCKEISLLPENERKPAMSAALAEQVARVLRLPAGKMNWEQPLTNMGVDSLMAAELQASISKIFGVRLSTLELMRGHNVTQLADVLTAKIILPPPISIAETEIPEESVIDRMSREDVDILLGRLLPQ
jgi:NAD(P)-dependent dehydrogenase (short-subunit alcohol dehydrogenase family)/acyl carrier protein